jgi:branched-chain amino acid transport system ATP-binding protein
VSVLEVTDLVAGYGRIEALHGVGLSVDAGQAVTVIGANGAGKTTLLSTVAGLLPARRGRVHLQGEDVTRWSTERRCAAGVALVPEGRQVFAGLSVHDHLLLGAYTRRRRRQQADLDRVYALFPDLAGRTQQLAGTLSGGQQQMLAIARALMSRPRVLLLDEPTLGLAPLAVREVVTQLRALAHEGTTLVLVEQNASAAFAVAPTGSVLERGHVIAAGPVEDLREDERVHAAYLGSRRAPR